MRALDHLKRINTNPVVEDSVPLRLAVLVTVMAAALGLLDAGVGSGGLGAAVVIAIPAGYAYSHLARDRTGYLRKALLGALAAAALARFLSTAGTVNTGGTGGLTELRLPLAELFLVVQVLHSFDLPARRDLQFSLLSSVALVLVGGVLSTSPEFGTYLAVWATAGVVSLVLAHRSQLAELAPLTGRGSVARAEGRGGIGRTARAVAAPTALALAAATATFLVMPAAGSPRLLGAPAAVVGGAPVPVAGGLVNPGLDPTLGGVARPGSAGSSGRAAFGYFGFSRSLDLGARGRPDDTPIMRVRAGRPDFWRAQTFDVWDGRRWRMSDERPQVVAGGGRIELPPPPEDRFVQYLGRPFVQTFYLQRPQPNLIFAAYKADQLYLPTPAVFALSDGSVRTGFELDAGTVYTVVSRRPSVTEAVLRAPGFAPTLPAGFPARYTQLPEVPERVRALAAEVTAGAPTVYDKVRALERWMGANTSYTLDIPPLPRGADAVEQYLFVDRKGFCEQIATALVVMLRSLGIPARVAVGYTPGERDPFTGLYQVRARDAHAWAEVYFPRVGWQGFDPTAEVPLSGDAAAPATAPGLFSFLGKRLPALPDWTSGAGLAMGVAVAAAGAAVQVRTWLRRRSRARARSWAEVCLDRLDAVGGRRGRAREPWETTREYVQALSSSTLDHPRLPEVVDALEAELFSGVPVSEERRRLVETVVAEVVAPP